MLKDGGIVISEEDYIKDLQHGRLYSIIKGKETAHKTKRSEPKEHTCSRRGVQFNF